MQSLERLDERLRRLEVAEPMQAKAAEWAQLGGTTEQLDDLYRLAVTL